jgi:hypothetical protein
MKQHHYDINMPLIDGFLIRLERGDLSVCTLGFHLFSLLAHKEK